MLTNNNYKNHFEITTLNQHKQETEDAYYYYYYYYLRIFIQDKNVSIYTNLHP